MTGLAFSLGGKTALVTGAGQGIGAAIATRFAEAGARVVAANRTVEQARALAASLVKRGLDVAAEPFADLSRTGLTKLVERVAREGLDILVHNAGSCPWAGLEEMSEEVLDAALDVNLRACFWLTQAAIPHFRARGEGRILVTSSVTGPRAAMVRAAHYAAAKAGVNGFIRAAALELACDRITVNGVEPGFIAKPGRGELGGAETMARIAGYIPLGAMGEADDVAYAMLYLASPQAKYVTGQTIVVDGGALLPETGYAMDATRRAS
ncbi:MAG TPA: SDR family oxidoreductase [Roseiarcus sp.]|nr:SDR family oxidoreductase [Roseiarcus sp.]